MILAYGIVTILAVIVGSVTGHTLAKYFANRRAEKRFEKLLLKAVDEATDEIIKEMLDKRKGNEVFGEPKESVLESYFGMNTYGDRCFQYRNNCKENKKGNEILREKNESNT